MLRRFCASAVHVGIASVCIGMILFTMAMLLATLMVASGSFLCGIEFLIVIMGVWCMFTYASKTRLLANDSREIVVIMLFCFLIHLVLIGLLPTMLQNGISAAWDSRAALRAIESGKICYMHNVRNQYWCNYEILLSTLGILIKPKLAVGQILNALCCVAALYPVFRLSGRIGGRGIARFCALIMGLYPAAILYSTMLTSEYLSAVMLLYGAWFLFKAMDCCNSTDSVLPAILCGCFIGMSHIFKSITIIFVCAMVVVSAFHVIRSERLSILFRNVLIVVVVLCATASVRSICQNVFASAVNDKRLVSAASESSLLLYELVLGLNVATDGVYSRDLAMKFIRMDESQRWMFAKEIFKRDYKKYPLLMARKFLNLHGSHLRPGGAVSSFTLSFRDWPLDKRSRNHTPQWVMPLTDCSTLLFRFLAFLGALGFFMCRGNEFRFVVPGLFASLIVLEFAVIEQLIEGHGRYKTAIYPFYFLILPYIYVWFEKDNPVYRKVGGLVQRVKERLSKHER